MSDRSKFTTLRAHWGDKITGSGANEKVERHRYQKDEERLADGTDPEIVLLVKRKVLAPASDAAEKAVTEGAKR